MGRRSEKTTTATRLWGQNGTLVVGGRMHDASLRHTVHFHSFPSRVRPWTWPKSTSVLPACVSASSSISINDCVTQTFDSPVHAYHLQSLSRCRGGTLFRIPFIPACEHVGLIGRYQRETLLAPCHTCNQMDGDLCASSSAQCGCYNSWEKYYDRGCHEWKEIEHRLNNVWK